MRSIWSAALPALMLLSPVHLAGQAPVHPAADSSMQAGWLILDRARNGHGREFDRARDLFQRAHDQAPQWALPLYGIGLAEGEKGDWLAAEPLNLGTRVGHGAYRSAIRALIEAVSREPGLTRAIIEMDRIATTLRDTACNREVVASVRDAVASGNADPATLLILGRRERAMSQSGAAMAALRKYQALTADSSLASYEIARTLLGSGGVDGMAGYFAAARSPDSLVSRALREDLVPVADANELARFDSLAGEQRELFLRQFWDDRARRDLRSPEERIREHFRRLLYARQHYALSNNRRYYGRRDLYQAPKTETLDDRGVVYVRQGEPDQRLQPLLFGLMPNETWLYRRPDGDLLLHFSAGGDRTEGGDLSDYRLVPSVFDLRGNRTPQDMLIASRFPVSTLYQKIMSWGPYGRSRMVREEREWGERSAETGTRTDAFELHFVEPLEAHMDLVAVGREGTRTRLQLIYGLPAVAGGTTVRFRIALFDSTGRVERWLNDSALTEAMGDGGSGGRFEVSMPPGPWFYRFALEAGEAGTVSPRDSLLVPNLGGPGLAVSHMGLGQHRSHIRWEPTPGDTVLLTPDGAVTPDTELQLYYEIYGLAPGTPLRASVAVYETRGNRLGKNRLRLTFADQAEGEVSRIRRGLLLSGLEKGEYWLELGITSEGGGQVVTRKRFRVISVAQ